MVMSHSPYVRLEHGTKHHITNIEEFLMQYKLLTEIYPQTVSLRNMGYRVNQGNNQLKNTPETIYSNMINDNLTRYYNIIFAYSKDRNKKHQK